MDLYKPYSSWVIDTTLALDIYASEKIFQKEYEN